MLGTANAARRFIYYYYYSATFDLLLSQTARMLFMKLTTAVEADKINGEQISH